MRSYNGREDRMAGSYDSSSLLVAGVDNSDAKDMRYEVKCILAQILFYIYNGIILPLLSLLKFFN